MSERDWEAGGESRASSAPDQGDEGSLGPPMDREGSDSYSVKLPVFEGPLDLLLHLIRQNDVDITDIPVAEIGQQYLAYLEVMQSLNLDVAGEYLVMAATLALIKSRMLLPPEGGDSDKDEIDGIVREIVGGPDPGACGDFHIGHGGFCNDLNDPSSGDTGYWCSQNPPRGQCYTPSDEASRGCTQTHMAPDGLKYTDALLPHANV